MTPVKQRESNIELLRLMVMAFIVLHHFIFHGLGQYRYMAFNEEPLLSPWQINLAFIADSFLIAAVNVFVLISGYFSIKFKAKSFVKLLAITSFFAMLCFSYFIATNGPIGGVIGSVLRVFQRGIFVITNQTYWFIQLYFILMFLSGPINIYVENSSKKSLLSTIGILAFINIYIGWIHQVDFVKDGYNILNFVMLYLIGRYIKLYHNVELSKRTDVLIYLVSSIITACYACALFRTGKNPYLAFCYNSPFVIISAIAIFIFFSKLHFSNKAINYLASSCLAIYLMQDGGINFYQQIKDLFLQYGLDYHLLMMLFVFFVISMTIPLLIDKIRFLLFGKVEKWCADKLDTLVFKRWFE